MVGSDWDRLLAYLAHLPKVGLAYSGGLDSRFLAHAALAAGCDVLLLHARGAHMPGRESDFALRWAAEQGMTVHCFAVDVLTLEEVKHNGPQRCYFCKQHLLRTLKAFLVQEGQGRVLCDGTNADDESSHRPGLRALQEEAVLSPLARVGLGKACLRQMGAETGLALPQQEARPCLLTRLNYGLSPDKDVLFRLEESERVLEEMGFKSFRLRLTPEPVLQCKGLPAGITPAMVSGVLEQLGFSSVRIAVEECISGFFDR